jgi:hypothetical protein
VVECLPSKHEALRSNSRTANRKKRKGKERIKKIPGRGADGVTQWYSACLACVHGPAPLRKEKEIPGNFRFQKHC